MITFSLPIDSEAPAPESIASTATATSTITPKDTKWFLEDTATASSTMTSGRIIQVVMIAGAVAQ